MSFPTPAAWAEYFLAPLEGLFNMTGNPIHAWTAYRLARQRRFPVPGWVYLYLDGCASQLLKPDGTQSPESVTRALRLDTRKGGSSAARRARTERRNLAIVNHVLLMQKGKLAVPGVPPGTSRKVLNDIIFAEVGSQFHLSTTTVKNIFYGWTDVARTPRQQRGRKS